MQDFWGVVQVLTVLARDFMLNVSAYVDIIYGFASVGAGGFMLESLWLGLGPEPKPEKPE